jgi:hypothetical protein
MVRSIHSRTDYDDSRPDVPVTLEQVKNLATRAASGLSPAEHSRLLRGIELIELRLAEQVQADPPEPTGEITEATRLRMLWFDAAELAAYWADKPHLGGDVAARQLRPIINKAITPKDPSEP